MKFIKDILTGADNCTFDNTRFICLLSFIVYFWLALQASWPAMDFASGIGTMTVAFGVNLRLKYKTEPKPK